MSKRAPATLAIFKIVGEAQAWRCSQCRSLLASTAQIDHKVPLQCGGSNELFNLQILCVMCHAKKTQRETVALLRAEARTSLCPSCFTKYSPHFRHKCKG